MVRSVLGLAPVRAEGGGANDNVAQNGPAINRRGFYGAVAAIPVRATLSANQSVLVTARIQHKAEAAAVFTDLAPAKTLTLAAGAAAATVEGLLEMDQDLDGAEAQVRVQVTADLSAPVPAAGVPPDTATFGATLTLGEPTEAPV